MKNQKENTLPKNTLAFIQLNSTCNQKCAFCNRPPINLSENDCTKLDEIEKRILELSKDGSLSTIVFTGGETLLYPKLSEVIQIAKKHNLHTEIQTNGTLLHTQIEKLKQAGLDKINYAFHSHKKEISDKLRGTNFGFEKINENLIRASKMGFDIHVIHVINSLNYEDLPQFIEHLHSLNLKKFWLNLSLVVPEGWAWENKWVIPRYIKVKPFLIKAMEKCKEYNIDFDISEIVPLCIVTGFEQHAISTLFKIANINIVDDYISGIRNLDFINPSDDYASKAPQCKECKLNNICAGFYPKMKELYGVSDFIPFKGDPLPVFNKLTRK